MRSLIVCIVFTVVLSLAFLGSVAMAAETSDLDMGGYNVTNVDSINMYDDYYGGNGDAISYITSNIHLWLTSGGFMNFRTPYGSGQPIQFEASGGHKFWDQGMGNLLLEIEPTGDVSVAKGDLNIESGDINSVDSINMYDDYYGGNGDAVSNINANIHLRISAGGFMHLKTAYGSGQPIQYEASGGHNFYDQGMGNLLLSIAPTGDVVVQGDVDANDVWVDVSGTPTSVSASIGATATSAQLAALALRVAAIEAALSKPGASGISRIQLP